MKTKAEVLEILEKDIPYLKKVFHVEKIGLFGSYARQEQTEKSDLALKNQWFLGPQKSLKKPKVFWSAKIKACETSFRCPKILRILRDFCKLRFLRDLMVGFQKTPDFLELSDLEDHLSDLVGFKVEIVTPGGLKDRVKQNIMEDMEFVSAKSL